MQTVKRFVMDGWRKTPLEEQIQAYLDENPNKRVTAASYVVTGASREALVFFYEPDEKKGQTKNAGK